MKLELIWFERASDATVTIGVVDLLYNRTEAAFFKWNGFTTPFKLLSLYFASLFAYEEQDALIILYEQIVGTGSFSCLPTVNTSNYLNHESFDRLSSS